MEFEESPASETTASRRTDLAHRGVRGELERIAQPAVSGELVAAITHDLRQPLTAVEMNVSAAIVFLRRPTPTIADAIDALSDALVQQRRMRDALQVLQNLAIRRQPQREVFDLVAMVREVVGLVNTDALARRVPLELDLDAHAPISGDTMLVRQALLNIVLDALEATSLSGSKHGPVRVAVRTIPPHTFFTGSEQLNGTGGAEVAVTHFGDRAEVSGGDHWGLALARSVVHAHGATMTFEGNAEVGVIVRTQWPMHAPEGASFQSPPDA